MFKISIVHADRTDRASKSLRQKLFLARAAIVSEGKNIIFQDSNGYKQMTNWSVSTFKGKLKFLRFKIVEYKTRAFNRKFEINPIPISLNISLNANNHL